MKKFKLLIGAFILFFAIQSNAQVSISLNIGSRPEWCGHYEDDVEYFYLPEIEAYYDVNAAVFIYLGPGGWIRTSYLPEYCHNYDLNRGYKVVLDYRGRTPYTYFNHHRQVYYRDNYRNYRQEYYHPREPRRSNYVAMTSPRPRVYAQQGPRVYTHQGNQGNNGGYNNGHGNGNGNSHGNGNGHGNGHDRGNGRR
ncbi:hypothetical protein [Flavobacterium sp.]|uniref:hypothetical protein n=1 Tax=Flavobacterium sp. TaxID=239 RepID=UPI002606ECE5|nr:hypothetical protein [Flavobacterium sp.]